MDGGKGDVPHFQSKKFVSNKGKTAGGAKLAPTRGEWGFRVFCTIELKVFLLTDSY